MFDVLIYDIKMTHIVDEYESMLAQVGYKGSRLYCTGAMLLFFLSYVSRISGEKKMLLHSVWEGRPWWKNYLLLHSAFTFPLECSVFLIQSSDVCFKDEADKKNQMGNSTWVKCSRCSVCVRLA